MSELALFLMVAVSYTFGAIVGFIARGKWDQV